MYSRSYDLCDNHVTWLNELINKMIKMHFKSFMNYYGMD